MTPTSAHTDDSSPILIPQTVNPQTAVNLRKKIHTFLDKCPSRIRMLDKVVQLALASYDLGPKLTWRTGPRLFRGAFCAAGEELAQRFSQMAEMKSVTIPPSFEYAREGWLFVVMTQSIRDTARKVCGMANAPGNELSDENFKEVRMPFRVTSF
jgi:hypothetical protein